MARRPRIGITMRIDLDTRRFYLGRDYSEVLEASGAVPVHIALIPKRDYIAEALAGLDGILLPGSNTDVDPFRYGQEPHHRLGTVIPEKDETDRLVIDEAERRQMPLMAICFGMQALNVARGGTLIQDIESQVAGNCKHEQGNPLDRRSHGLVIDPEGFLSKLPCVVSGDGDVRVNSSHHQALGELGTDLRAIAWAKDGIIECVEDTRPGRFNIGVQWHPEVTAANDQLSREIFSLFVDQCKEPSVGSSN